MGAQLTSRHARHLYKVTANASTMFSQLGGVLSKSAKPTAQVTLLLLETVGRLYEELGAWRKRLAAIAVRSGLSQRVVADALRVSRRTVQVWVSEADDATEGHPMQDECQARDSERVEAA